VIVRIGSKGLVNIIEFAIVIVTLFASFSIFFSGNTYSNRWEDAYSITRARDITLALDRIGRMHEYAYDKPKLDAFLANILPASDTIFWSTVTGGVKDNITVACNCTDSVVQTLQGWASGTVLNRRNLTISFCKTNLNSDDCMSDADVVLIWGYKRLASNLNSLSDFALRGGGVVEVMDFSYGGSGPNPIDDDVVQTELFGLDYISTQSEPMQYDAIARVPRNATDLLFQPVKHFYHIPLTLSTGAGGAMSISGCSYDPAKKGFLSFNGSNYGFWVCNDTAALVDTDGDGTGDAMVNETSGMAVKGYNMTLNYVLSDHSIAVSFKPTYNFGDFATFGGGTITYVLPSDRDSSRIFIQGYAQSGNKYPVSILNRLGSGNLVWISDFSEGGYGDDEKALLLSTLVWASSRELVGASPPGLRASYVSSYMNVENYDMFEIYKFNLGVGYPS
jgi:hypothetical protein